MTTILVRHTVESYEDWKPVFDTHESIRRLHGATGHRLLRDGNNLTILTDFADSAGAHAFAEDPSLREAMAKGKVVGQPDVAFLDDVETVTY